MGPSRANFDLIKKRYFRGVISVDRRRRQWVPLPVVSFDQAGTPSLLKPIQAFRWFIDYGGRAGTRWINSATRVLPATPVPYHPALCAPFVKAHTLLMVAPKRELVHANYSVARQAYELIPGPKQWYDIPGGRWD